MSKVVLLDAGPLGMISHPRPSPEIIAWVATTALDSVPAVSITGASGSLSLNLIGNTSNTGYGVSKLQFYANGNTGPIVNDGSAKQVAAPLP
jgi:hypothetical protein